MAGSSNFFRDNEDLQFQFRHGVEWAEIVELLEAGYTLPDGPRSLEEATTFYDEALEAIGEFVANEIAPVEARIDRNGARLVDGEIVLSDELQRIYRAMGELGFYGLNVRRELDGMGAPLVAYFAANEILARAEPAVMNSFAFHGGITEALMLWSAKEGSVRYEKGRLVSARFERPIREIASGEAGGCMVLTEPDAGSDLAAISTRAVERDGRWRLTGEKIFITAGHAEYQVVLARTEPPGVEGLKALSLFLVPRFVERGGQRVRNVEIAKLEEKIGHHGSATVSLVYDDSEGELIGRRGEGFKLMLALMNSARIGVSFEGIGNAEAALRLARGYAAERRTMGKPIERHELVAEKLFEMDLWVRGLRALAYEATNATELSHKLGLKLQFDPPLDPEVRARMTSRLKRCERKARRLTPLLKYLAAEQGVQIAREAMQIHGGMGYSDECLAHKKLRDALVLPIYEGTSQIQALMATKDHLLWSMKDPAGFVRRLARARLLARTARGAQQRALHRAESLALGAIETLLLRTFGRKVRAEWAGGLKGRDPAEAGRYLRREFLRRWDARADFAPGLLHAERLTRMLGEVAISKCLVRQGQLFSERRELAERFLHRSLLRVEAASREIELDDGAVLAALARLEDDEERAA